MKRFTSRVRGLALSSVKARMFFFAIFLSILIVLPALIHSQWLTGPIVNAVLLLALVTLGLKEAILLGLMPSAVALSTGLLPIVLAPMLPLIMAGNALLVFVFHELRNQNYFLRITIASLLKFAVLHFGVLYILSNLLEQGILAKLSVMMSWPQFFTAMIGGLIVYPIIKNKK